jgi:hypothetical protein
MSERKRASLLACLIDGLESARAGQLVMRSSITLFLLLLL